MDARAGENDTPKKLKKERINTKLNRRKEAIQKILFEIRPTSTLQKEQAYHKAMNAQEDPEDKPKEESRPYGHKDLSKHHKTKPRGTEEGVGTRNLQTTIKDNVQVTDAFTVICSDM